MFTNVLQHGGELKSVLKNEFGGSTDVIIASGYTSSDIIEEFNGDFLNIARNGGSAKLLLGMAFYEGLSRKKLDLLRKLCVDLNTQNSRSGVYVTWKRKYHGKVYCFTTNGSQRYYIGSSNFSGSGITSGGNIECTISVQDTADKDSLRNFLVYLLDNDNAKSILDADIVIHGSNEYKRRISITGLEQLATYNTADITPALLPYDAGIR